MFIFLLEFLYKNYLFLQVFLYKHATALLKKLIFYYTILIRRYTMSSFGLKMFALLFMIIDHIGYALFPQNILMRTIGRLSFPLFAYQMAIGFSHTKNKPKHILKLLLFACLCQFPHFLLTSSLHIGNFPNIIFTFVLALLICFSIETIHSHLQSSVKTASHPYLKKRASHFSFHFYFVSYHRNWNLAKCRLHLVWNFINSEFLFYSP